MSSQEKRGGIIFIIKSLGAMHCFENKNLWNCINNNIGEIEECWLFKFLNYFFYMFKNYNNIINNFIFAYHTLNKYDTIIIIIQTISSSSGSSEII